MDIFDDEDNNPFAHSDHQYANGFENSYYGGGGGNGSESAQFTASQFINSQFSSTQQPTGGPSEQPAAEQAPQAPQEHPQVPSYFNTDSASAHSPQLVPTSDTSRKLEIIDAGHVRDSRTGSRAIAYTIQHGPVTVARRYSEFDSLRRSLVRLFPTVIVPPIPQKHSVVKYFLNPLNARNDIKIIEKRKRMLNDFLVDCDNIAEIHSCIVWAKFLDPNYSWGEVLQSPPVTVLPPSSLLAPPLDPTKPSPLHLLLPVPQLGVLASSRPHDSPSSEDKQLARRFQEYEDIFRCYGEYAAPLESSIKRQKRHFKGLVKDLSELGAYFNAFSLEKSSAGLSRALEKVGIAVDINFLNSEALAFKILTVLEEPVSELIQYSSEAASVLQFRKLKELQLVIVANTIRRREARIAALRQAQQQADRLEQVLKANVDQSRTMAAAVKRLESGEPAAAARHASWLGFLHPTAPGGPSASNVSTSSTRNVSLMNETERTEEIALIDKEVAKLNECLKIVRRDLAQVNESLEYNIKSLLELYSLRWRHILKNYTKFVLIWLGENLAAWKDAKEELAAVC